MESRVGDFLEKKVMIDGIKRFGDVQRHHGGSTGRLRLIEANGNVSDNWEECCNSAVHGFVSVLSGRGRKRLSGKRKKKTFQDFDGRGQEGVGTVAYTLVSGFSWFGDGDYDGLLPDSRLKRSVRYNQGRI
jgi:hypothetical protein